jgi:glycosyltransferase involved in cell wall biosynthesis
MIWFTVVTITYNAEAVLQRTLQSVLRQTYGGVEHLIIDGASKDGTLQMAEDYKSLSDQSELGHKVIIKSEPDKGIYDAMNKGLLRATGDYILYLNAGDYFPSETTLETVANSVGEGEELPAVLYGDTDIVDEAGNFLRHRRLSPPDELTWKSFRHGMLVCHQAFYARTDLARPLLYNTQYRHSADVDWCIRVMKAAEQQHLHLRNVHAVVACFLAGGDSKKHHRESLYERFSVMRKHYGLLTTIVMHLWFVVRGVMKK